MLWTQSIHDLRALLQPHIKPWSMAGLRMQLQMPKGMIQLQALA